ncbi:hypothetical protein [Kordiimonas sp. SCSIO 12610]|uniref:hypothetical protein n=1 Tax=Kordiimonas sp. SCSIO 12610 TaxID=2829597 RepID=UPI00210D15E5|nr:hypothetical protein [Kordiimonas sp. SCSIO 12610]UTW55541.1 hypothetical protein KFF44_01200 [Kordiimonas sp. SCSIO 12610]
MTEHPDQDNNTQANTNAILRERRMHLRAFDYWEGLRGDREFPDFDDLKSEDLNPFKDCCLLLDVSSDPGGIIRFIGDRIDQLIDAPAMVGVPLSAFPHASFATALVDQLSDEQGHYRAVEFEFIEDLTDSRGILLPFTRYGEGQDHIQFVLVVANFRNRVPDVIIPIDEIAGFDEEPELDPQLTTEADTEFESQLMQVQNLAGTIVHPDIGTRESLYRALEHVYRLYYDAQDNVDKYKDILSAQGLKVQARAPFTPLLKLIFGKTYDKTRLTEYASALAYATRMQVPVEGFADFLMEQPGGIKGCVKAERAARRGESGTKAYDRQEKALTHLRQVKGIANIKLDNLERSEEFILLLARKKSDTQYEVIGPSDIGEETLDAAIRRYAAIPKK